jgi:hypothetical protein
MSVANYTDLQTAIANWLARDGDGTITARIPDFIALCEARIAYGSSHPNFPSVALRVRAMEKNPSPALVTVAGTSTVALPSGYLSMRKLQLVGSPNISLRYLTPLQMDAEYNDDTHQGQPVAYTIEGENIRLGPTPDAVYSLVCVYYQKLPSIITNASNWLTLNSPGVYLYGSLLEATPFIGDDARAAGWYGAFTGLVNSIQEYDSSDRHAGAVLTMRSDVSTV